MNKDELVKLVFNILPYPLALDNVETNSKDGGIYYYYFDRINEHQLRSLLEVCRQQSCEISISATGPGSNDALCLEFKPLK